MPHPAFTLPEAYASRRWLQLVGLFLLLSLTGLPHARGNPSQPDYFAMAEEIESKLHNSLEAYDGGNPETAQTLATAAYFQVFENMEGPIRVNLGQRRNFMLELRFAKLRKLIDEGAPLNELEELVFPLIEEVNSLPPF